MPKGGWIMDALKDCENDECVLSGKCHYPHTNECLTKKIMETKTLEHLTRDQKLLAIKLKYYDNYEWNPKKGDYYTSCRNDLELYQIVGEDENYFFTNYCNPQQTTPNPAQWPKVDFKKGFGDKRIYVPDFVFTGEIQPKQLSISDIDHLNGEIARCERALQRLDPSGEGLDATDIYEFFQYLKELLTKQ